LVCVTHDPAGNNNLVKKLSALLNEIYKDMFITVSEDTNKDLVNEIKKNGFNIKIIPPKGAANARRTLAIIKDIKEVSIIQEERLGHFHR
jgi:hypothetical protein